MSFRTDLEGLRGVAVALVVLFHARLLGVAGGFVGVDAFYVLSGFLITGLLVRELGATGRIDLGAFYARRARRILPAASVAIALILAASAVLVAPLDLPQIAADATSSGLFVGNIAFAARATDYFASTGPSPFLHYWSLGVEEQFYLAWPLLLAIAFRFRRSHAVTLAVVVVSLLACIAITQVDAPWAFYSLPTRAWQLALGALLAMHGGRIARLPTVPMALAGWLGLALLGIAATTYDASTSYPGIAALTPTAGVGLVILAGGRRGGAGRVLGLAPLRWLGRISFSLYLYHWPVLVLIPLAIGEPSLIGRGALVLLSVVLALASYLFVERPFRMTRIRVRQTARSFALAAVAMSAVVLLAQSIGLVGAGQVAAHGVTSVATEETAMPVLPSAEPSATVAPEVTVAPAATALHIPTPHVLRPSLAGARNDTDGLQQRGCGLSLAGTKPPLCVLGTPGGKVTVALVGDSHAAQWAPALELIAQQRGWRLLPFTKDSCIFLDMRIISIHLEREYTECAAWREQVVVTLAHVQPDLVVVSSSRWVHPVSAIDDDPARQADAMARLVSRLPGHVVVIADTPLSAVDVPACLSKRDTTFDLCATARDYALTRALDRDGPAAEQLGAALVDPAEWLCGPDVCPAVIDWTIVYRDDHHLTATMARRLAPLLEPTLLDALAVR
ncbi:MAG: acyltransferase [Chloroflexota bacterium]|nr:acyltransferase [Chloroflexota bacterium]